MAHTNGCTQRAFWKALSLASHTCFQWWCQVSFQSTRTVPGISLLLEGEVITTSSPQLLSLQPLKLRKGLWKITLQANAQIKHVKFIPWKMLSNAWKQGKPAQSPPQALHLLRPTGDSTEQLLGSVVKPEQRAGPWNLDTFDRGACGASWIDLIFAFTSGQLHGHEPNEGLVARVPGNSC